MGYYTYESYAMSGGHSNFNPNDSTTYYFGLAPTLTSTNNYGRMYIPRAGTIRKVYVYWFNSSQDCTAEDTTITVRKNNTTDCSTGYTGTFANAASPQSFDCNMDVSVGDYLFVKLVCPAWVTNPTGVFLHFTIEIQC